jgi:hypothetical protein
MARAASKVKEPESLDADQVDDVIDEAEGSESTPVSHERALWSFDHNEADALFDDAKKKATA